MRAGIIYLPGAPRKKNGQRKATWMYACILTVYARYVAISIVQHVPREWKTNVFKSAPFVPADVCARVGNSRWIISRMYAKIIHSDLEEKDD
jgi:hypothetical protein